MSQVRVAWLALALAALIALCWPGGPALALTGDREDVFGLDGRLAVSGGVTDYTKTPLALVLPEYAHAFTAGLRLMAGGWATKSINYELHLSSLVDFTPPPETDLNHWLSQVRHRYQALDLEAGLSIKDDTRAEARLDRAALKLVFSRCDLTLGRQAITFGKAYFWNPLDVFSPFDPQQLDRDYKMGVDAARLDIPLGAFSGLNIVLAAGRRLDYLGQHQGGVSWYGSSLLARGYFLLADWDVSLQAGKIYGGWQAGGAATGELAGVEVRFEAAYFMADPGGLSIQGVARQLLERPGLTLPEGLDRQLYANYLTAVFGLGRRFSGGLTLELEYLYNGLGTDGRLDGPGDYLDAAVGYIRQVYGVAQHRTRHLLGLMASYEFLPIVVGQVSAIFALCDGSFILQPSLNFSLSGNTDLTVGAAITSLGERSGRLADLDLDSEFGNLPDTYFIELKWYF